MLQRHALQKLHSDERLPVLLANVVNRADVWVIQYGRGLGLTLKAGECLRVTGNLLGASEMAEFARTTWFSTVPKPVKY
jgi:hypothetical protein